MAVAERRFRAMGCDAHVVVAGGPESLVTAAIERTEDLEARWSRFRPTSEISRLNEFHERPVIVSPETLELIARSVYAWRETNGAFDPTVLPALMAAGYDRSFDRMGGVAAVERDSAGPAPGCAGIVVDTVVSAVTLPSGVTIDPGGIGKGLAGDIVVAELLAAGAAGAMLNLGGDVRVAGIHEDGAVWTVAIADPFEDTRDATRVALTDGAVATSSKLLRRWSRGGRLVHHLIDPATGSPYGGDIVAVTVVAREAWWAEAMTKAVFAAGVDAVVNAEAWAVAQSGAVSATAGWERMVA